MFKRMLPVLAAALALTILCGCACDGGTATATPSPTLTPTETPMASASASPDAGTQSPALPGALTEPSSSPDASATGEAATIPDFKEGTEVKDTDVPKVTQAIKEQYPNAEVVSIKHAMQSNQQAYAVVITTSGTERTVYVLPDGTMADDASAGSTTNQ